MVLWGFQNTFGGSGADGGGDRGVGDSIVSRSRRLLALKGRRLALGSAAEAEAKPQELAGLQVSGGWCLLVRLPLSSTKIEKRGRFFVVVSAVV